MTDSGFTSIDVLGVFTINFTDRFVFANGGGVINYKVSHAESETQKTYYLIKQFYQQGETPDIKPNGETCAMIGELRPDVYKDKQTGSWVDKGTYIKLIRWV
jgi:hypothetical protein